jgi:DNA (cytosine-5)-methyltransferase 1
VDDIFRFSVISAFAGAGGSSLGYKQAGGRILLAIDSGADAVATYRANFPDTPVHQGDIADLSVEACCRLAQARPGELDVFDGSPPCLGFSMLGSRRFGDPRNRLYKEFVRLLRGLRPKAFVMENVSGLVTGTMRVIFVECLKELKASGYRVRARLLNVAYFGVPQARKRIIFVGVREDLGIEPSHPRGQSEPRTVRQALGLVGEGAIKSDNQFRNRDPWRSLDQPCPALTKHAPLLLLGGDVRPLAPTECGVLSGFPADFRWGKSAHRLIGNAVPPRFMKTIAEHVRDNVLAVSPSGVKDKRSANVQDGHFLGKEPGS